MKYLILLVLFISGCATPGFKAAGCQRMRYPELRLNILVCNDDAVDAFCHKYGRTWDDGTPIDSRRIRACFKRWSTRPSNLVIGQSYLSCVTHELCHAANKDPKTCERDYPCLEDRK